MDVVSTKLLVKLNQLCELWIGILHFEHFFFEKKKPIHDSWLNLIWIVFFLEKNESFRVDGEQLFYPAIPLDVAFIRATSADPAGNLSLEKEALLLDNLVLLIVFLLETSATSKLLIPNEKKMKKKDSCNGCETWWWSCNCSSWETCRISFIANSIRFFFFLIT